MHFSCDKIKEPFTVGPWDSRDRMRCRGASGERSLKRLFAERHIPPQQRERIPVLRQGQQVAGVWGIGPAEPFCPEAGGACTVALIRSEGENR